MEEYTIHDMNGAIICRGIWADNEEEAIEIFIDEYPAYNPEDFYASISNWND